MPTIQFAAARALDPESTDLLMESFTSLVQPRGRFDPGTIMGPFSRCIQKRYELWQGTEVNIIDVRMKVYCKCQVMLTWNVHVKGKPLSRA